MTKNHADQITFRESLVKFVKQGRWAPVAGETLPDLAHRLGVTLEILHQAMSERTEELRLRGKPPRKLGNRRGYRGDYGTVEVTMPVEVHDRWTEFCRIRGVRPSTVLRSLVHHFLLTKIKPRTIGGTWLVRGTFYRIKPKGRRHAKARVTRGAQIALDHYADIWNTTATGIVRGLIASVLETGTTPEGFQLVACAAMWGDSAKYLEPARTA